MSNMRNFFLTLDLEEWYHLEYFQNQNPEKTPIMVKNLSPFFNLLDKYNIKITVFVLGELIDSNIELIKDISNRGHDIGIHGWDHRLLQNKTTSGFINEILRTKEYLESIIDKTVIGYRAPCFSLNNEKLEALKRVGIKYDSSYIKFKEHPLYGDLSMDGLKKINDLVYEKEDFYEFELPTIKVFSKNIPISGGGYFRLIPKFIFSILWRQYLKTNSNFVMYIHPFELTEAKVHLRGFRLLDKIRFSIGRKNNLKKLEWFLKKCLNEDFKFVTISNFLHKND